MVRSLRGLLSVYSCELKEDCTRVEISRWVLPMEASFRMGRIILLLVLVVAPTLAQEVQENDANATLVKRVEQLEHELQAVKAELAASKTANAKASVTAESDAAAPGQDKVSESTQSTAEHRTDGLLSVGGLKIRTFGDIRFRGGDLKGQKNSFEVNDLDFLFTGRLSDKITALSEITFELGEGSVTRTDARRAMLQFQPSNNFKIAAGRFQTGIGFYNTAYYHARWLATTADRPLLFQPSDEGGVLPTSLTGVTATGAIPSGRLGLSYLAEFGTADVQRTPLMAEDGGEGEQEVIHENRSNGFNVGLISRPTFLRGLQTGFTYYQANLSPEDLPNMRQTVMAAHIIYQTPRFEFLNEFVDVRHSLNNGLPRVFHTPGAYSQISQQFHNIRPYFRYEYLRAAADNPLFEDVGRRSGPLVGFRYDFTEYAAFKGEYQHTGRESGQPSVNSGTVQLDFTF
jgi:hypothetical protein